MSAWLLAAALAVGDLRLGGILELEHASQVTDGRVQKSELILQPALEWRGDAGIVLTAIGRLRADAVDRLEPGQASVEAELRELHVDLPLGRSDLRIGKQQIVWGRADGLKVLDLVNPQSFREFILDEFEDSRLPLWSLKWELPLIGPWVAEWVYIPDLSYHELPREPAVFGLLPAAAPEPRRPRDRFGDADSGVQIGAWIGGWDVTLNALYHYHDLPVLFVEAGSLQAEYRRTRTLGASAANAFGDFSLRLELGHSSDRYFGLGERVAELSYVIGLDWSGLDDTLLSAQLFQSRVNQPSDRAGRKRLETDVTLLAQREFLNRTWAARLLAIQDADRGDGVITLSLRHDLRADLILKLESSLFHGPSDGRFGRFGDRDRVLLGIEYGL